MKTDNLNIQPTEQNGFVHRLVKLWKDKYIPISLPIKGWMYYLNMDWGNKYRMRFKPRIIEVHKEATYIKGWRFDYMRVCICWGRYKIN